MAAFTDFASPGRAEGRASAASSRLATGSAAGATTGARAASTTTATSAPEAVPVASLDRWRADGWPCPERLPGGYVLLDARQTRTPGGQPTLHLTYGDGLSAVSVFLQHGALAGEVPAGWRLERWGRGEARERDGYPELMVWQGGGTVFTAVGDAGATDLRATLAGLPRRQADDGALDGVRDAFGSVAAWLPG
jgi:hypothetical protein